MYDESQQRDRTDVEVLQEQVKALQQTVAMLEVRVMQLEQKQQPFNPFPQNPPVNVPNNPWLPYSPPVDPGFYPPFYHQPWTCWCGKNYPHTCTWC